MKYPIGIQSFETLRKDGYVYVDKTDLVYKLAQGHVYFLSRPRRFGKSLLVSTLKAYFEGRKDLFKGLMIGFLENKWTEYPVLVFDFNAIDKDVPNSLINYINQVLSETEAKYNLPCFDTQDISLRFRTLIPRVHEATGKRVVVLIDEYDKPLLDLLETGNPDDDKKLSVNRQLLKNFFSVFKSVDDHLRFVMLTGITKFSQVSMFSGFNQPDDISFEEDYEALCGITQIELEAVFDESIQELSASLHVSQEEALALLKQNYDGYHFSTRMTDVYNPFSVINALKKRNLEDYWFASGTPSYLVRLLGNTPEDVMSYTNRGYTRDMFVNYKADSSKPLPMLFQAGYLTIKGYDKDFNTYRLDFPNKEVKQGLITLLANNYLGQEYEMTSTLVSIVRALRDGDLEQVRKLFTGFLAETPYSMRPKKDQKDRELYFHYTFYLLMRLISCYTVYTEKQLSEGRADCIIETPKYVYIFEFKLDGTADEALQQINERGYARAYEADARAQYIIGASFSSKTGTIEEWKIEQNE
ncbi:MAG: ATP-binding protein [Prevotella sp.]|nr:ATP-binding protein [Prevotella sp.]